MNMWKSHQKYWQTKQLLKLSYQTLNKTTSYETILMGKHIADKSQNLSYEIHTSTYI